MPTALVVLLCYIEHLLDNISACPGAHFFLFQYLFELIFGAICTTLRHHPKLTTNTNFAVFCNVMCVAHRVQRMRVMVRAPGSIVLA